MQTYKFFPIVLISLIFNGCGGDSDGESSTTQTNLNPSNSVENSTEDQIQPEEKDNRVAITAQNSTQLARTTYHRFVELGNLSDIGSSSVATGAVIQEVAKPFNFIQFAKQRVEWVNHLEISNIPSQLVVGAVVAEETLNCRRTGSAHFIINDNDQNDDFSKGDTIHMTFQDCQESVDQTLDGKMVMKLVAVEQEQSNQELSLIEMNFDLTGLTAIDFEGTQNYLGGFNIRVESQDKELSSVTLTTDSFTVITADSTETLSKLSLKLNTDLNTSVLTLNTEGVMTSSQLGGSLSFKTLESFKQLAQDTYPYTGSLKITGRHDSSVTLIALDAITARLDIDENGDGASDQVTDVPWNTLFSI